MNPRPTRWTGGNRGARVAMGAPFGRGAVTPKPPSSPAAVRSGRPGWLLCTRSVADPGTVVEGAGRPADSEPDRVSHGAIHRGAAAAWLSASAGSLSGARNHHLAHHTW